MKSFFTLVFLFNFLASYAQNPTFAWAKGIGGNGSDNGRSIVTDAAGNVYTAGYFSGTADFDPGGGTFNLTSAGLSDAFISKLDASGNFVWAKSFGSTSGDVASSVALDGTGNVYVFGSYTGTVDFDPGTGTFNQAATGQDIYLVKLDASGSFVWAKSMGGSLSEVAGWMVIDASGNIYGTGSFNGSGDFDPGTGTTTLTSAGSYDIYIFKLDASGNFVWAKSIGGSGDDSGRGITIDASGNLHSTGIYRSTVDFDPGSGISNSAAVGIYDMYILKMDALGNLIWVKSIGGPSTAVDSYSIAVDATGNVLTTGSFPLTADFDPGTGTSNLTSAGSRDVFISKLNPSGNFVWAKRVGNTGTDEGNSVTLDGAGNVYVAGYFNGTVDFDPGAATTNLVSAGAGDIFLLKFNSSGDYTTAFRIGGTADDRAVSASVDGSSSIYLTGYFASTVDFDPGSGTTNLTSVAFDDIFIAKFLQAGSLPLHLLDFTVQNCGTNVCLQWLTENEYEVSYFEIEKSKDGRTFEKIGTQSASNLLRAKYTFEDKFTTNGVTYYRLKMADMNGKITYSKTLHLNLQKKASVKIWPNPVRNTLYLSTAEAFSEIRIYDAKGSLISTVKGNINNSYNLMHLKRGTYQLQLIGENDRIATQTIVKE